MTVNLNDGARPSRLELDARATGERGGEVPPGHAAALEAARGQVAPFDWELLRARSRRVEDPPPKPAPERRRWWWALAPLAAAAAAALLVVRPGGLLDPEGIRVKGELPPADLECLALQGTAVVPLQPGMALSEGDRVQFVYDSAGRSGLVLLSIDGEGQLTVFWPAEGDAPEPIDPDGEHLLADGVELDDAAGPEVFLGFFGAQGVAEAREQALEAWGEAGVAGLRRLAEEDDSVDLVVIEKE